MSIGPVQLLVIGFEHGEFHGKIQAELERLSENDIVRVIDVLFVRKDADGRIERTHASQLGDEERSELGAIAGALIGLGAGGPDAVEQGAAVGAAHAAADKHILSDEVWYVDDVLPPDSAAAVVLLEHRWAIGLRDTIRDAGGFNLADAWVHPLDLVAIRADGRRGSRAGGHPVTPHPASGLVGPLAGPDRSGRARSLRAHPRCPRRIPRVLGRSTG